MNYRIIGNKPQNVQWLRLEDLQPGDVFKVTLAFPGSEMFGHLFMKLANDCVWATMQYSEYGQVYNAICLTNGEFIALPLITTVAKVNKTFEVDTDDFIDYKE